MIVASLILYNYGLSLLKHIGWNKCNEKNEWRFLTFDIPTIDGKCIYIPKISLKFDPPLTYQRYEIVKQILSSYSNGDILKVIDFGCSEIRFFPIIKHMKGVQEYLAVDIDSDKLQRYCNKVQLLPFDYLRKRTEPLVVQVLNGSVSQPDLRLQNSNAVIAIELIEHLYPDTLEELPYNIFGLIQPEIAVFTTPNSDFNILFPNFKGFRHNDHKFEWSREQFQSWANNLVLRYPNYKVIFGGIGLGPDNCTDFGHCTQIAVFLRNKIKYDTSLEFSELYQEIIKVEYPFYTEKERLTEIIVYETEKFLSCNSELDCYQINGRCEIPIKDICSFLPKECCYTEELLSEILKSCGKNIQVMRDGAHILILPPYGRESLDNSYSSSPTLSEENDLHYSSDLALAEEENWDINFEPMAFTHNGVEKANDMNGESAVEEFEKQESMTFTNESSLEPSNSRITDINSSMSEEAHFSCDTDENGRFTQPQSTFYTSYSTDAKEESAVGKLNTDVDCLRSSLQKCHSFENMNRGHSKNNPFRFSLNIDKYKLIDSNVGISESSDIQSSALTVSDKFGLRQEDSCSQSKAADSGYPNSYGQDMDLDLTPEQVDEIVTESESSFEGDVEEESGGEDDEPMEIRGEILRLGENVENGDVANNNRDGEGNNMEAVAAGGVLQFEQVIAEEEVIVGNLAGAAVVPDWDEDLGFVSAGETVILPGCEGEVEEVSSNLNEMSDFQVPNNVVFPQWLLSILADDLDSEGEGDAHIEEHPRAPMVKDSCVEPR